MNDIPRKRKLHGVPKRVRGQFDFESTPDAAATLLPSDEHSSPGIGDVRRLQISDAAGGYDEIEFDDEHDCIRMLAGGAPHNAAGAAVLWNADGQSYRSYWLHGREVDQVAVARLASGDPRGFDDDFRSGWFETVSDILGHVEAAPIDEASGVCARALDAVPDTPVDDAEVLDDPETAASLLGTLRAVRTMRRAYTRALLDGGDWRAAVHAAASDSDGFLQRL